MRSAVMLVTFSIAVLSATAAVAATSQAQAEVDGELVYRQQCARCHEGGTGRMASSEELRERTADQIYGTLNFGLMRRQGLDLSDAERRAVAMYLSGGVISDPPIEQIPQNAWCATDPGAAPGDPLAGPAWNGWGNGNSNSRFQSAEAAGLTADDVPDLRLKWAFGFPGANSSGSQASVAGGRILIGSRTGLVYAIDAKSGCITGSTRPTPPFAPRPRLAPVRTARPPSTSAITRPTSMPSTSPPASSAGKPRSAITSTRGSPPPPRSTTAGSTSGSRRERKARQ